MTIWKCSECGCHNSVSRDACQACFTTPLPLSNTSSILASAYGLEIPKVIADIIITISCHMEHNFKFQSLIAPNIKQIDYVTHPCSFHGSLVSKKTIYHMDIEVISYLEEASHVIEGNFASMSTMARRPSRIIYRLSDRSYCLVRAFP